MTYVLDKEGVHARLIQDMEHICFTAGVAPKFVEHSMVGIAQEPEVEWFKKFNKEKGEHSGLMFHGGTDVQTRMMALCGALVRNFIDARLVTLASLVPLKESKEASVDPMEPTVLLVPNLHVKTHGGKPLAAWQIQILYDAMISRMTMNKQTVVFVESLESLGQDYGVLFRELLESHYKRIEG